MKLLRVLAWPAALTLVAACGGGGSPSAAQSGTASPKTTATARARPVRQTTARPPAMAGVTARGALVLLSSATGTPVRTLVPQGVIGDELSVSRDGRTIYFSRRHGCVDDVESVAVSGGTPDADHHREPARDQPGWRHARVRPAADADPALHEGIGRRSLRPVQPGHPDPEQRGGAGVPDAAGRPVGQPACTHLPSVLGTGRHRAGRVHRRDPGQRGLADHADGHRHGPELPGRDRGHAGAGDRPGPAAQLLA